MTLYLGEEAGESELHPSTSSHIKAGFIGCTQGCSLGSKMADLECADKSHKSKKSLEYADKSFTDHFGLETSSVDTDELRLANLGYKQETKRIFTWWTSFGLAASMISVMLGIIPLYGYSVATGGPAVMLWSWVIIGFMTLLLVASLGEISCAFPTMGALYYWAFRLGGPRWGPFVSWTAGWCNLIGQFAGVASGGYAGAEIIADIVQLTTGTVLSKSQVLGVFAAVLMLAGIVNSQAELLLTALCHISVGWHVIGTVVIVAVLNANAPTHQSAAYVVTSFNNDTPFTSGVYVALIGSLSAASTFTGYDTAAHVSEETTRAHSSTPVAMLMSVVNCIVLGLVLIVGLNSSIQDIDALTDPDSLIGGAATLWQSILGDRSTVFLLVITFVAVECSNCANLTSAARMVYAFSRDGALPFSKFWYHLNPSSRMPDRAIWLCVLIAFLMGVPGVANETVLEALFSLTATGLYSSYLIPILLRVTISGSSFTPAEFHLGRWSIPCGVVSVIWALFMIVVLCLPQDTPVTMENLNYSPVMLGGMLAITWFWWLVSARHWFKGIQATVPEDHSFHATLAQLQNSASKQKLGEPSLEEPFGAFDQRLELTIPIDTPLQPAGTQKLRPPQSPQQSPP